MSFVLDYIVPVRGEGNLQEPESSDDRGFSLSDNREVSDIAEITDETTEGNISASMFPSIPSSSTSISTRREQKIIKKSNTRVTNMKRFLELEESD